MYQTSADFVQQMDRRPFQVLLTGAQGSAAVDTLEYSAAWCPSAFTLGATGGAGFTAALHGRTVPFQAGEQVSLTARLEWGAGETESEEVPLGIFELTQVERAADTETWSLAGEDAMSCALAEEFFCVSAEEPPATGAAVLAELCARAGLALEGASLLPQAAVELEYDAAGGSGQSMRELVGQMALLAGANARIGRAGELRLCRLTETEARVGPQRYYESGLTVEAEEFTFGALEVTVPGTEAGEAGLQESERAFTAQLEGESRGISVTSPWFDQSVFDGVWQAWQGEHWRPAQVTFLGDPRLDPGDVITVTDRAGTDYRVVVMGLSHSFDGGWRTTVSCYAPAQRGETRPQSVSQAITGLKTDLGRFRRLYADNLSAAHAQFEHLTTEDIVGEHGTINLAEGTFTFGDALSWDGDQLVVKGVLESEQGSVGGWTIDGDTLCSTSNGGRFKMELKPAHDDEYPCILFQGADGTAARIEPYVQENYGTVQRLDLKCGDGQLGINYDGSVFVNGKSLLDLTYPVGSIYMSVNATSPQTLFGGTWTRLVDRMLIGAGSYYKVGDTGGETTHRLTANEIPSHTHPAQNGGTFYASQGNYTAPINGVQSGVSYGGSGPTAGVMQTNIAAVGGNAAHNNMPPYRAVYMWQRTA